MSATSLRLPDLVDLEARIVADADADPEVIRARDRRIYAALPGPPPDRAGLLRAWLDALRVEEGGSLGERVARVYRLLGAALVLGGLLSGWGAAAWALRYDGRTPVNVAEVLLVLVGPQLVLLALLLPGLALAHWWPGLAGRLPLLGDLRDGLGWLASWLTSGARRATDAIDAERRARWRHAWHRLRSRRSLYRPVERWTLMGLLQGFGVAFNTAALLFCLQKVVFSDLAFAWSTTLDVGPDTFHALVAGLAAPWSLPWPDAVPTADLVAATRYSRLEAAYAGAQGTRAVDPTLIGAWWRFLVAALLTYGLVPRLALLVGARVLRARALRRLPLDNPDVDRVVRRLTAARVEMRAEAPAAAAEAPAARPVPAPAAAPARHCHVVLWRGVPAAEAAIEGAARRWFEADPGAVLPVEDFAAESEAHAQLARQEGPVLVVAEAWEAPDKAIRRFLRDLRAAVGARRPLVVGLVGEADGVAWPPPAPENVRLWREHLAALEDPYLGVEPLEGLP